MSELLLSPQQETAMLALLSGQPQRYAAQLAGVREEQVSRWMNDEQGAFLQIYAARRASVWQAFEARIAGLVDPALSSLEALMRSEEHTGRDSYDPRTRLEAIKLALQLAGLLQSGPRIFAPGSQLNVGQQQINHHE